MRPIILATDYGISGPYVGQLKTEIYKHEPNATVIDLIHDLPQFNPKASAFLLASYLEQLPKHAIVIGVVDPGVGSTREPMILEAGGFSFVGPNNGLFAIIAKKLKSYGLLKIIHKESKSKTFHGRDVFVPTAVKLATNQEIKLKKLSDKKMVGIDWLENLEEIIYIDYFGNAVTGIGFNQEILNKKIRVREKTVSYAEKYSDVLLGAFFWYFNSNKLLEISARETSVAEKLQLKIGDQVTV